MADGGALRDQRPPPEELDPHPIISDVTPHICWEKVNEDICTRCSSFPVFLLMFTHPLI